MNRILLTSDTHGRLDSINESVNRTRAQMVIHAGDFGFYDEGSIKRLSNRELKLLIVHSPYKSLFPENSRREELVEVVLENHLLGDFQEGLKVRAVRRNLLTCLNLKRSLQNYLGCFLEFF